MTLSHKATFRFFGELKYFLPKEKRNRAFSYIVKGHPAIKDTLEALGVPHTESDRGIRKAFRDLAKTHHPDRVGPGGTRRFQDIMEAYTVLSDPERRREYNDSLRPAEKNIRVRVSPERTQERGEPEPLIPEPISVARDFQTINLSFDEMFDRLARNFTVVR